MRYEILKFLSTGYDYKDLGGFLKIKYPNTDLKDILFALNEMYNLPEYKESNIIEIDGRDWELLGQDFVELNSFGKVPLLRKDGLGIKDKDVISKGVGDLDNCKVLARITDLGRKELQAHELNESIKQVNNSVLKTNSRMLWVTGLAALFALGSVVVSVVDISTDNDKSLIKELILQRQQLQEKYKSLKDSLQMQNPLNGVQK